MSDFEVVQFVKGNDGKTRRKWRGNARPRDDNGFTLYLDTIHGDVELVVQRKQSQEQRGGHGQYNQRDRNAPF